MTKGMIRPDIYKMIKKAVKDGLTAVRQFESSGKRVYRYFQFPKMSQFPFGFPNFTRSFLDDDVPPDYRKVFREENIAPESIPSWQRFWDFAHKDKSLSRFWGIGPYTDQRFYNAAIPNLAKAHSDVSVYGSIERLVDRYIHVSGKKEMEEGLFRPIYQEWERNVFLEHLPVNIVIPILCVTFSFERLEISQNIFIEKMDDSFQLARNNRSTYTVSAHETVIGLATHSLVLKEWSIKNNTLDQRRETLDDISSYSEAILPIENFFAAFRSETLVETGYSQIVATPIGWADSWQAYLPPVHVVAVRAYPDYFERYSWLKAPPVIDEDTCKNVAKIFNTLINAQDNRLILAARRLNSAFLRANEEDSILDVTVGLEALLTSDTRTEITYKLAMRAAALSTIEKFEGLSPEDVFTSCKKIYDYRSRIMHGSKKAKKKRTIKLGEEKEISMVRLGVNLLRCVVKALSHHLEYLSSEKLDKLLVTTREQFEV